MLERVFTRRGWIVDRRASIRTTARHQFRVYASSAHVRAVAMFFDYGATDVRRISKRIGVDWFDSEPAIVGPGPAAVVYVTKKADAETRIFAPDKKLVVLLLRANTGSLKAETEFEVSSTTDKKIITLELWHVEDLQIDIFSHCDVPPQRKITAAELVDLKKKYGTDTVDKLPLMLAADPVARWLGLSIGDVVVSDRTDPHEGRYKYYRRVVAISCHPSNGGSAAIVIPSPAPAPAPPVAKVVRSTNLVEGGVVEGGGTQLRQGRR